jgi:hypothetical protein
MAAADDPDRWVQKNHKRGDHELNPIARIRQLVRTVTKSRWVTTLAVFATIATTTVAPNEPTQQAVVNPISATLTAIGWCLLGFLIGYYYAKYQNILTIETLQNTIAGLKSDVARYAIIAGEPEELVRTKLDQIP